MFEVYSADSALKVKMSPDWQAKISKEPFVMASGDVLEVGDKFTRIDKKGSAGTPPIVLTPPWYQQYEGRIFIPEECWYSKKNEAGELTRELILFSAHNPETHEKMYSPKVAAKRRGVEPKDVSDGYYIGYLAFCDNGLFFFNFSGSGRVVNCKYLERYNEEQTQK